MYLWLCRLAGSEIVYNWRKAFLNSKLWVGGSSTDRTPPPHSKLVPTLANHQTNYFVSSRRVTDEEVKLSMCTLISSFSQRISCSSLSVSVAHINPRSSEVALLRKLPVDWKQNISCGFTWVSSLQTGVILFLCLPASVSLITNPDLFVSGMIACVVLIWVSVDGFHPDHCRQTVTWWYLCSAHRPSKSLNILHHLLKKVTR